MRILDPINDPGWDHVVALHRDAGCFHTSAWAKVLHKTYNHQPFYLQFSRGRRLAALIPLMEVRSPFTGRRGVCLPFSDSCEPLIFDPQTLGLVRDHLVRFAQERRWRHLEIRGGKFFQVAPGSAEKFYGHTLDLRSGAEELAIRFASPVRRAIRKAERSGVKAVITRNRAAMNDFYHLHAANTPAARSAAATGVVLPEHLRAYNKPRSRFHCSRAAWAAPNSRRDLLPLRKERPL